MKTSRVIAVLCGLVLATGCEPIDGQVDRRGADPTDSARTPSPDDIDQRAPARRAMGSDKSPRIKLVSAGAEPRRALRYKFRKGAKSKLVMSMEMNLQTKMPGLDMPKMMMPIIDMVMTVHVDRRMSDTEVGYTFEMIDIDVRDRPGVVEGVVAAIRSAMDGAKGMRGSAIVDARGINRDVEVKLPAAMDPQMQQMVGGSVTNMEQMSAPLPEQPVGKGAKWELHQQIEQNGMTITQVTHYELRTIDGDKGKLAFSVTQSAGRQNIAVPGMAGATAELTSLRTSGSGEIAFDLSQLVPRSTLTMDSEYSMSVSAMGTTQTVDAIMEMKLDVTSR